MYTWLKDLKLFLKENHIRTLLLLLILFLLLINAIIITSSTYNDGSTKSYNQKINFMPLIHF